MRKILIILSMVLWLSSCSAQDENSTDLNLIASTNQDDYSVLIPFQSSPVRAYHGTYLGKADFIICVPEQMTRTH